MTEEPPPRRQLPGGIGYIYAKVADDIECRIREGEFPPGTRLPGRGPLAAEYRVGELTVRRAMRELRDRGAVSAVDSRGALVTGYKSGT